MTWMSRVKHISRMSLWLRYATQEWVMSDMNESRLIWMSHVLYGWVVSHMSESCLIWMSHVSYEWILSHMNVSRHMWMIYISYEIQMPNLNTKRNKKSDKCTFILVWMGHVTHEWVMPHISSHATYEHISWHTGAHVRVRAHTHTCPIRVSYLGVSRMNESCHTLEWVMQCPRISNDTHTEVMPQMNRYVGCRVRCVCVCVHICSCVCVCAVCTCFFMYVCSTNLLLVYMIKLCYTLEFL